MSECEFIAGKTCIYYGGDVRALIYRIILCMLGLLRICVIALKQRCSTIKYRKTLSLKRRPRGEVHVHAGSVFRVLLIFSPLNARFFWLFVITFPRFLPRLHFFRRDHTLTSLTHSLTRSLRAHTFPKFVPPVAHIFSDY